MTLKALAEVAGVSDSTVRRTAKELFPDKFKNGVKTVFNEYQSMEIMKDVTKKNMVAMQDEKLPMQSAEVATQNVEVIAQAVAMAMQTVMMPMMEKMMGMNKQPLQIEQPIQDHYTLMAYCSLHKIKLNLSEAKKMGMDVKRMTIESGKEINWVPDERWGKVNSYPVEILEEYFSV